MEPHFVAFHVQPSQATLARIVEDCRTFDTDADYHTLLDIVFRSARLFHPGAKTALISDRETEFDRLPPDTPLIRIDVDADRVAYSRVVGQVDYARDHAGDEPVVFLDSDVIVNADLAPLLGEDIDVALTYRDHRRMPLNGGVVIVRGEAGLRFLERVRTIFDEQFSSESLWWGQQRALIAAVGHDRYAHRENDTLEVDGARIRLLPCDEYNFSPDNDERAIAEELAGKRILHFKGERKRLMPVYWARYLEPMSRPASVEVG